MVRVTFNSILIHDTIVNGLPWNGLPVVNPGGYAAEIDAHPSGHKQFNLNVHIIALGGGRTTGIKVSDIAPMVATAIQIWSQAGVGFTLKSVTVHTLPASDWNLFDIRSFKVIHDDYKLCDIANDPNSIDVYFVNTIHCKFDLRHYGYIPGITVIPNSVSSIPGRPSHCGVLVAALLSPTDKLRATGSLARTVAHELGHYLLDTEEHPAGTIWNLMDGETDDAKRDLTWGQVGSIDVTTNKPDEPIGG